MNINKVKLTNYRNHKSFETPFDRDSSIIIGPNGSGKTNILEAIHLVATTKAFKARYDREVISHEETFAKVEIQAEENNLEILIMANPKFENVSSKKAKVNRVAKSLRKFTPYLYTVLFSPEEIEILRDSPSRRRRYMDMVLFQIDGDYKRNVSEYSKAVRQRNKILELINNNLGGEDQIDFWNKKIMEHGKQIQEKREELMEFLKTEVYKKGRDINGGSEIFLKYNKNEISENRLGLYREKEIAARRTLVGPHRDDFEIEANGYDLANFGSRGQQRTAILAMKLSEIDFLTKKTSQRPILLLDDIFSELDQRHSEMVLSIIKEQQTIITSTETHLPDAGNMQELFRICLSQNTQLHLEY